jgi:cellulose synthase/poly-beta-1,6-N-acetylglucosamine synthase-like glycosyltransferase
MAFLIPARRDATRSGKWATDGRAGPLSLVPPRAPRAMRRFLLGLSVLLALATVAAMLVPGIYTVMYARVLSAGVSVLLGTVACSTLVGMLRALRVRDSLSETVAGNDPLAIRRLPRPPSELGNEDARELLQAVLVLAIVASLAWLVWQRPGAWQYSLIIAATVALPTRVLRSWRRRVRALMWRVFVPRARRFRPLAGALDAVGRQWRRLPASARATIPLLALLNVLVALALVDPTEHLSRLWSTPVIVAFSLMFGVNLALLNSCLAKPNSRLVPRQYYLTPFNAAKTPLAGLPSRGVRATERVAVTVRKQLPTPRPPRPRSNGKLQRAAAGFAVVVAAAWIVYAHPGPLVILGVLVVGLAIPFTMDVNRQQAITMLLAMAVGVATLDYVSWRLSVTNWQGWWIAVPLLCAEALGAVHVLGFQFTIWPRPAPLIEPTEEPTQYPIFIFVPTLNEGVALLTRTLEGCIAARDKYLAQHPHAHVTIVVCNDGRAAGAPCWAEVETLAQDLGVRCVTRPEGGGAKAGNIENARQHVHATGNALLAIFDADQVPEPDFLLKTIPPFADVSIGWVQTGQYYANLKNPVARWADDQQSMFYNLLCPGKAALNAAFICGTNVVIRAAALDEIGGLPQDSVTEDFAASIALHPSWRSIYLTEVLATGLGPLDIPSYLKQQGRWARGTLGVLRSHWRDIFLPKKRGLRIGQRVQYGLACTHYLCGVRDLVYMLSPVLFIFTAIPAVRRASLSDYLWHFVPYVVLAVGAMWYAGRGVTGLRGIVVGFGSFPALVGSLVAVIARRKTSFAVTSKERRGRQSLRYLGIYVFFLPLFAASLVWATQLKGAQRASLFISVFWILYSLLLIGSFLSLAYADLRSHRTAERAGVNAQATQHYASKLLVRKRGLRPASLGLATLMASPLLLSPPLASSRIFASSSPRAFVIGPAKATRHYVGLSLPVQLLTQQPSVLERDLGVRFSIIGRTQDIRDRFDTHWADKLAAQGARPWITLQFGIFGPGQRAPLDASLPAIFNGVRDSDIKRWATAIRNFGQPVYLTILPHADKNWSLSSGVARGGIPADVAKAWIHTQSLFRAVGAKNVAWVWAPADPIHDQAFAPPVSTVDAVLQSFINYPRTPWGDPERVLRDVTQRYPGKSLFVEASAAGPPAQKAAWLVSLGRAIDASRQVYALLYHEGGPELTPTPAQVKTWSLASDAQSLDAMKRIVTGHTR